MKATIGLDFGGCNTEIYVKGKGIVLREPSVAAVDTEGNVIAVGTEALLLRGRAPGSVTIRSPIRDSVVSDFNLTAEMLDRFLDTALGKKVGGKKVAVAVKCGVGEEHRRMIRMALEDCRASKIEMLDSPVAAIKGCGENDENGILLCDIGGGSVECVYMHDGDILRTETYFGGGRDADKSICDYLRRRCGLSATKIDAREAKHRLSLYDDVPSHIEIAGLDCTTGLPKRRRVPSGELIRAAAVQIKGAADCISSVLSNLPHSSVGEHRASRVILLGGGAMLPGIAEYVEELCSIEAIVVDEPMDSVISGLGKLIEGE